MSIVTDSKPVEAPKDPERSTIFQLFSLFASKDEIAEMREKFQKAEPDMAISRNSFSKNFGNTSRR